MNYTHWQRNSPSFPKHPNLRASEVLLLCSPRLLGPLKAKCLLFFRTSRCLAESRCPATPSKASKSISVPCSTMPDIAFHFLGRGKSCGTLENVMWNANFWWWLLLSLLFNLTFCELVTEESKSGAEALVWFFKFNPRVEYLCLASLGCATASRHVKGKKKKEWRESYV